MNQVTNLVDLTIRGAGTCLARREVSAVDLVEAVVERISATEPVIHAYATLMVESALEDARQADLELDAGHWRGPLHGIPLALKDLLYTAGVPTEAGSRVLSGWIPQRHAAVVDRLTEAGAIIVGKTHTHEFAYGVNTPPTRNPWRTDCYPGGSSAGSGAAVAARSAFGALGTDGGGSIRCPAAVNGIVGLKPTTGRVSRRGVVPMSATFDNVGPLTRTVEDCALLLGVMAGYDPDDPISLNEVVLDYLAGIEAGVNGVRLGVERSYFYDDGLDPDVRSAMEEAIAFYTAAGAEIVDIRIPELEFSVAIAMPCILADTTAYHRQWLRDLGDRYESPTRVMIELGELIPATHYVLAQRARRLLRDRVRTAFEAFRLDALLLPTLPGPTVPVDQLNLDLTDGTGRSPGSSYFRQCVPANIIGVPALSIPAGLTSAGLPIGLSLFGRPLDEALLFRIGRAYEVEHGWSLLQPPLLGALPVGV